MEYKSVQFEIIELADRRCWKWVVFLGSSRIPSGVALTRADAVLDAQPVINENLENRTKLTKP